MYEGSELDYQKLEYLRKETKLGPVAMMKLLKAKKEVDDSRKWYQQNENELIEADYSIVDELEYEMRRTAYQNKVSKEWSKYMDGIDLEEFAETLMDQQISNQNAENFHK